MIVGFDSDDETIFSAQLEFLRDARILHAMLGMLHAIPKTPLHARLKAEGRLDENDTSEFGTNVVPRQISRESLRNGYLTTMQMLYEPGNYFARLEDLFLTGNFRFGQARKKYWSEHRWIGAKEQARFGILALGLLARLMWTIPQASLRKEYRKRIIKLLRVNRDPSVLFVYVIKCAMHFHHYTLSCNMSDRRTAVVNTF
jgi:Domain of unknown function (DUF4070)